MKKYQERIGDGKLPNIYYVFHYDEKLIQNESGDFDYPEVEGKVINGYLGQFKSYEKALECVDNKAYLPHVMIEDRITGVVFEQYVQTCNCCNKEEHVTNEDIQFTKDQLGKDFK